MMEGPRPPIIADFFDDRLAMSVTLRKRRYQMRIRFEVAEMDAEEIENAGIPNAVVANSDERLTNVAQGVHNTERLIEEADKHHNAGRLDEAETIYKRVLAIKPNQSKVEA